ncbi:hypothetical protein [Pelagibacterium sp. H642]|uniref:hypothetical protein n=1 Tax=Pelagibacterium sp. H642 TaxID=1881069 RepID=UPI002814E489|nr:hypothetical protein [Pelagibacterium sp. H642]WMT92819.1 hypothetical protein NO934_18735 [Pelagibacterium sp. H642]
MGLDGKLDSIERLLKEQNIASSQRRKAFASGQGPIESDIKISAGIDAKVRERLDVFEPS